MKEAEGCMEENEGVEEKREKRIKKGRVRKLVMAGKGRKEAWKRVKRRRRKKRKRRGRD